jgi:hypothetical protein
VTSVIDAWRAVDPQARLVSGSVDALGHSVRGVLRTRTAPPHLPPRVEGQLLVVEAALLRSSSLDELLDAIGDAGLDPVALLLADWDGPVERGAGELPVLASARPAGPLTDALGVYLADESAFLERIAAELRLKAAEAALAEPLPAAPAGLVATGIRRGVAVAAEGALVALTPRPAGRALAARFAAVFARLLAASAPRSRPLRRTVEGLWLLEQPVRAGASVWLFDDLPLAAVDAAAADALSVTLRALLRRPAPQPAAAPEPIAVDHRLDETLLAVARANGRVATAARALGVHRNTVLYRLRRASADRGVDPRRPADALRLLREAEGS